MTINGQPTAVGYAASNAVLADLQDQRNRDELATRRDEARYVREVWDGKFAQHVDAVLRLRFHPNTYAKLKLDQGIVTTEELIKDVVKKLATGWSNGSEKMLLDPDGQPTSLPAFTDLMDVLKLDELAEELEMKGITYRGLFVMPVVVFDERIGQRVFEWCIHTPETFTLLRVKDAPTRWRAAVIFGEMDYLGVRRVCATIYEREQWTKVVNSDGDKWAVVDSGENIFKCIPGVFYRRNPNKTDLWGESDGLRLANKTVAINAWSTYQQLLASGWLKTLVGGTDEEFPSGQYTRHGAVLKTGGAGTAGGFQLMDFTTDLNQFMQAMIETPRNQVAISVDLSATEFSANNTTAESGTALGFRYWARDRQARKFRKPLKSAIKEAYAMAWWVLYVELARGHEAGSELGPIQGVTTLPGGKQQLPPGGPPFGGLEVMPNGSKYKFVCDPAEMTYPTTEAERQQKLLFDLDHGYTTDIEELMRENPDLTAEQAMERIKGNKSIQSQLSNAARIRVQQMLGDRGNKITSAAADATPGVQDPTQPGVDAPTLPDSELQDQKAALRQDATEQKVKAAGG